VRRMRWGIFASAVVLMLAGCKPSEAPQPQAQPASAASSAVTPLPPAPGMPFQMALELDAPPRIVKASTFRLQLTDLAGKPVSGAQVQASLTMKLMDMGKNEFPLAGQGNGRYEGSSTFSMAGVWNVVITAQAGSQRGEQKFEVTVKD